MSLPDDRLSRRLKAVPGLKAPASLLPRVMAAAAQRGALPWWKRAWWTWPVPARAAYAGLLAFPAVLVLAWAGPAVHGWAAGLGAGSLLAGAWRLGAPLAKALGTVLGAFKAPLLAAAFFSYLSTVAGVSAMGRIWSSGALCHAGRSSRRMS